MLTIDGKKLAPRGRVLETCRAAGVALPAFCSDDRVDAAGHCRSCLVEVDGRFVTACTTEAADGMTVRTDTEALRAYRRDLGELMWVESAPAGEVANTLTGWGVTGDRYGEGLRGDRVDESHPFLHFDLDQCILCRLCLRACDDIQGQFVFAIDHRGSATRLTWGPGAFNTTDCVSCGACASICPTGAITDVDRKRAAEVGAARVVRTTCSYCGVGCQLDVHVADDRVVRIEGAPESPVNKGHLCVKGRYAHKFSRHPDRLSGPLIRRDGQLEPATWEEAIATIAEAIKRNPGKVAGLSSSRCTNEESYLVQKWMRAGLGTHNVDSCARVCHAPTAKGMKTAFGTGAATNALADIELADLVFLSGSNPTEAHPVTGARLKQAVLRGAKLIVVDPRETELAAMADVHLQLRPGTNVPLLNSVAHVIVEEALYDESFIARRAEGWDAYRELLKDYSPESLEEVTGVAAQTVRRAARMYAAAERPMQAHGLGMTEHYQGSEGVMLLCNLALLVGGVGRAGVGVNPLRGQNNVQGAADMGCQPDSLTGYCDPDDPEVKARFEAVWQRPLPSAAGMTLPHIYEAARRGDVKVLFIMGEDVAQTDPAVHVLEALEALELLVVQEIFPSETTKYAHVVLPAASFLEKDGTFTNGERRVQRVRKAIEPYGDAKPDWQILCELMAATGYPQHFEQPSQIMEELGRVAPQFYGVRYERLEEDGLQWPVWDTDHPGTARLHTETFAHGLGHLACVEFRPSPELDAEGDERPLRLITGRVLEHYNCGTMTRRSDLVELCSEDYLELHPDDASARGLRDGDRVTVSSRHGETEMTVSVAKRIAKGTAFASFHFPETGTNDITSGVMDRLADCPEYKLTAVQVRRAAVAKVGP